MDDPWKDRKKGLRCATCVWYVKKAVDTMMQAPPPPGEMGPREVGRCRRHAPALGGFPVVFPSDWCGDHRLDEAKT
jgi:hypothetical protein